MSHENPADYLERAAELIALDNGAINRLYSRDQVVDKMIKAVKANYPVEVRAEVEEFLSGLTAEELDDLCCGDQDEAEAPQIVKDVLNYMFNNM